MKVRDKEREREREKHLKSMKISKYDILYRLILAI